MPRYQITAPNGQKYEINAPDGASEQDVLAYAQSQFDGKSQPPVTPTQPKPAVAAKSKAEESGTLENLGRGIGQGVADLVAGPAQFVGNAYVSAVNSIPGLKDTQYAKDIKRNADQTNRLVQQNEEEYQAATPGSVAAGVGRAGTNIAGALVGGGGKAVTTASQLGELIPFIAGKGQALQTAGRLTGAALGNAGLAATAGALAPVTQGGDYWDNKRPQIGQSAALGAALPFATAAAGATGRYAGNALRSLVDPFTEAGQTRIAGDIIRRFAAGGPLSGNGAELVPGSMPNLAEATGNAGIGSLVTGITSANPLAKNLLAEQAKANNAARIAALSNIAGSDAARAAAIQARTDATGPMYEAAVGQVVPVDNALTSLLKRPSLQAAVGRAENLAQEKGGTFGLSQPSAASRRITNTTTTPARGVAPDEGTSRAITNTIQQQPTIGQRYGAGPARPPEAGRQLSSTRTINTRGGVAGEGTARAAEPFVPERTLSSTRTIDPYAGVAGEGVGARAGKEVNGQDLQNLKLAMDATLTDPTSGIAGREVDAVKGTRDALVSWMREKIPGFAQADNAYADMSKPIAQMDIAQRLIERYASATTDMAGNPKLRAEAFNRALQDEAKLLKQSDAFKGYKSLSDVFTPEQLRAIQGVADDLSRMVGGQSAGKAAGATTFQNAATNNILEKALPGPVRAVMGGASGPVGTVAGKVGNLIYGGANEKVQNRLLDMLMTPQSGLSALQNVGGNQLTGPLGGNALLQRLAPNLLPAGTIGGVNALSR